MQGHFGRCAGILELDLTDVEQELGQLEGALGQRLGLLQRGRLVLEQLKVMVAQHPGAGAGGHHHRPVVGEQLQLRAGDRAPRRYSRWCRPVDRSRSGPADSARSVLRARAGGWHQASLGIEQIHHAGTEQVDLARLGWILAWQAAAARRGWRSARHCRRVRSSAVSGSARLSANRLLKNCVGNTSLKQPQNAHSGNLNSHASPVLFLWLRLPRLACPACVFQ